MLPKHSMCSLMFALVLLPTFPEKVMHSLYGVLRNDIKFK